MDELHEPFKPPRKWIYLFILIIHVSLAAGWMLSYWITHLIYGTWFPQYANTLLRDYLTVELTIVVLFVGVNLFRIFFAPVRRQMEWFMQLINAMKQLAKGDFNINLQPNPRFTGQFTPLVTSFNEMASELRQMEQMRQEFISNVSHEFQSPLTSITGFARAMKNDDLDLDTRNHYLDIIETESKRLSRLSDNLLKLTSLESNHHPFEPKSYRLDRQIRRIILSCEPLWLDKNIEMDVDLPEFAIVADEDLMSQVWVNLLHNSIKFTPEGGTITVTLAKKDDRLRIVVADTGKGISAEALPHLFERFYKEDKARNRANGGSGLGLSIVKKIVEMHGGEVFAANRSSSGAAFTVVMPIHSDSKPKEASES
ncbi:two-component sensor histidine kinase [Cohnella terricola]|uniref:histidine kinase n=2 Tax=Cohnella terricola TaxID=1289167 RepID=A0A559JR86_9BACL|nr:two-component sensor histidine kinase [Cohnella terricola]